ncbi:hypothetical protein GGS23DRAFT_439322 [Durotheca rogersii]|uniref:uncharacterized protein n=1 Tax=Durotheca rogersii TaxID=419775 RepID=UPI00221F6E49|nr:uncharacterized protein GGS23DRAFT_439322 [Durotheca rogersii]KAI5855573.1 hypothetical protein GGS23DRAFT_439322 [Durotheca rogersii]
MYSNADSMEFAAVHRRVAPDSTLPLRPLQPRSSRPNAGLFENPFSRGQATSTIPDFGFLEPTSSSPLSFRSGSSFSQESCADSWDRLSTGPPSPRSPKSRHGLDELGRLDWIPARSDSLKRKSNSADGSYKKVRLPGALPGVDRLLVPSEHEGHRRPPLSLRSKGHLYTPSSSPEPGHDCAPAAKPTTQPLEDPITQKLNLWRKESDTIRSPLPQPGWLEMSLDITLDYRSPPAFYRHPPRDSPRFHDRRHLRPRQQPSPPGDIIQKERARSKDIPHCNVKYALEEKDYIRFNKVDLKLAWREVRRRFRGKFPMDRRIQGIQGIHYRDNDHMPHIVDKGRTLVFLPNGHIKAISVKVRDQGDDKPYFGLIYLYPERAVEYDWVPAKDKQAAAELVKERIPQRELKKQEAIARGTWVERLETGECACCPEPDRERDTQKGPYSDSTDGVDHSLEDHM